MGFFSNIKNVAKRAFRSVGGIKGITRKMGEAIKGGRKVGGAVKQAGDIATSLGFKGVGGALSGLGGGVSKYSGMAHRAGQLAQDTRGDVASAERHARMGSFGGVADIGKRIYGRFRGSSRYVRGGSN
tara:strand:+ start:1423 stop:1806 length:384 start_codon:yes stop_codon:yes gene_type:complete